MNAPRWLMLVLSSLLLVGCIDLTEEIWVDPDGRCRVEITTGIHEELLALNKKEDAAAGVRKELERLREYAVKKLDARVNIREYDQDRKHYFALVANLDSPEDVATLLNQFHAPDARENGGKTAWHGQHTTEFATRGGGLRFEKHLRAGADRSDENPKLREFVAAMFRDGTITVRLHAESVKSPDGEVAADGKSVQWIIPISEIVLDPDYERRLIAEMPRAGISAWWLGAAALAMWSLYLAWRRPRAAS